MSAFHSKDELAVRLSQTEKELVLSAFPTGASVAESHYFDNYDLPCPIKVKGAALFERRAYISF